MAVLPPPPFYDAFQTDQGGMTESWRRFLLKLQQQTAIPGSLVISGDFAVTFTLTGLTSVIFPTSGTLATTADTATRTGTGTTFVMQTSPTLITPILGVATGTSLSLSQTLSLPSTGAALAAGNLTLVGGTKTINTTRATATCVILLSPKTAGGTVGNLTYTIVAGVSFTVTSDNVLDTSTISFAILETH